MRRAFWRWFCRDPIFDLMFVATLMSGAAHIFWGFPGLLWSFVHIFVFGAYVALLLQRVCRLLAPLHCVVFSTARMELVRDWGLLDIRVLDPRPEIKNIKWRAVQLGPIWFQVAYVENSAE